MPRCPECYRILSHRRLDTHLTWCRVSADHECASDELEELARQLNGIERRIERRIEAIEAEFDRPDTERADDPTPQL